MTFQKCLQNGSAKTCFCTEYFVDLSRENFPTFIHLLLCTNNTQLSNYILKKIIPVYLEIEIKPTTLDR